MFRRVLVRLVSVVTAFLILVPTFAVGQGAHAEEAKNTYVLRQVNDFDYALDTPSDGYQALVGKSRSESGLVLQVQFSKAIRDLVNETSTARVTLVIPGNKVTFSADGDVQEVATESGAGYYGIFEGTATVAGSTVPVSFTLNHDGVDLWIIVSVGYANKGASTVIPFGKRHGKADAIESGVRPRVAPTSSSYSAPTGEPDSVGAESSTDEVQGRGSNYIFGECNGTRYDLGGMVAFGPNNARRGQSLAYGGRVFTQSRGADAYQRCRWPAFAWNDAPYITQAVNKVTMPQDFYGSGADPGSSSGDYNIVVPIYIPYLQWQLQGVTLQGKSTTATFSKSDGALYQNVLTHTWKKGTWSTPFDPARTDNVPGVPLDQQGERGFAGQALFAYQGTTAFGATVYQDVTITYVTQATAFGSYTITVDGRKSWALYGGN